MVKGSKYPSRVYQEIEAGRDWVYYTDLSKLDWVEILPLKYPQALDYIFDLDRDEAEVLILAREISTDLVILDETLGRRYVQMLELTLTGTIGILLKAKEKGQIQSVKALLIELQDKGVWLSSALIDRVTTLAGE